MHAPASTRPAPPPTLASVLLLALPIMMANASTPLIGFVDAVVVGRLGEAAPIGGVAVGATIFNAIYWFFAFLRMGTTGFTAQALGAQDGTEIAASLIRALLIATVIGIGIVALQVPIRHLFLSFLGGSAAVQEATRAYYDWRIWAAPAGLINFALLGWFIGLGRTMMAFWIQLGLNLLNMALAVVFALWMGLGVGGVGLAAFLAETIAAAVGLGLAWREARRHGARLGRAEILDAGKLKSMIAVNRDLMIRTACVLMSAQIFVKIGAEQGDAVLAANALLTNLLYITYYLLDGYANAAETLVGQAVGARDRPRLDVSVRLSAVAAGITGIAIGAAIWWSGPAIIGFMTPNAEVRAAAAPFLTWAAILPFVGVWCFLLDGIFVGATRTADMRNMMVVSFVVYLGALAALVPWLGNHGLWAAHCIFFAVRALTLGWRYPSLAAAVGPPSRAAVV